MESEGICILGAGSIGMALAVHLANSGRRVTAVRTSTDDFEPQYIEVTVSGSSERIFSSRVEMVSLARLTRLAGIIVIAAKSYANRVIASRLRQMEILAPVVIMQNGVGVENPYLDLPALRVYRCVLYATGQKNGEGSYTFIPVTASPIGVVRGTRQELLYLVGALNTGEFPFAAQGDILQQVWKKATINSVFNSICTLLETDNGIFIRNEKAAQLAREVVDECVAVMQALGFGQSADDIMEQLFAISTRSDGQLISTLQDVNNGRDTEIDQLNLEIARIGRTLSPPVQANTTRVLGEMVRIKSMLRQKPG